MKKLRWIICLAACCSVFTAARPAYALVTAFTLQGQLMSAGAPASGNYDLQCALFTTAALGSQFGPVVIVSNVPVRAGLFTTTLDFGTGVFNGTNYWLDISVRQSGGGAFVELTPRQQLTPTPYAVFAVGASTITGPVGSEALSGSYGSAVSFTNAANIFSGNGSGLTALNASQLTSGSVPLAQLPAGLVTNNATGLTLSGSFSGDGSGLANVSASITNLPGGIVTNNASGVVLSGTFSGNGSGLTGISAAQLTGILPNSVSANFQAPNYNAIGGGLGNNILSGAYSVIDGGQSNQTFSAWSVIGGGNGNEVGSFSQGSTIGGGFNNTNTGNYATVPGGFANVATGDYSFAAGNHAQAANAGSFVWADNSTSSPFVSTADNSFNVRANGGVALATGGAGLLLDGQKVLTNDQSSVILSGTFSGLGSGLTGLNASQLTSGSVPSAALTSVPAASLTGTISPALLPAGVLTNASTGVTLSGAFSGNGGGLTNLSASELSGLINGGQIAPSSITSSQIAQGAVQTGNLGVGAVTQINLAQRPVGTNVPIGGIASSPSIITNYTNLNGNPGSSTPVPPLTVTLVTSGRPVMVTLNGASASGPSFLYANASGYAIGAEVFFYRNGVQVSDQQYTVYALTLAEGHIPPSVFQFVDLAPAGTNTYSIQIGSYPATGGSVMLNNVQLLAFEY